MELRLGNVLWCEMYVVDGKQRGGGNFDCHARSVP